MPKAKGQRRDAEERRERRENQCGSEPTRHRCVNDRHVVSDRVIQRQDLVEIFSAFSALLCVSALAVRFSFR